MISCEHACMLILRGINTSSKMGCTPLLWGHSITCWGLYVNLNNKEVQSCLGANSFHLSEHSKKCAKGVSPSPPEQSAKVRCVSRQHVGSPTTEKPPRGSEASPLTETKRSFVHASSSSLSSSWGSSESAPSSSPSAVATLSGRTFKNMVARLCWGNNRRGKCSG